MRRLWGAGILVVIFGGLHVAAFVTGRGGNPPPVGFESPEPPSASVAAAPVHPRDAALASFRLNPLAFISRAPVDSLVLLPGVGPVTAARIVADRDARGPFTTWKELDRVRGIGPATIARLVRAARRS
jgi:competence protein ComEA